MICDDLSALMIYMSRTDEQSPERHQSVTWSSALFGIVYAYRHLIIRTSGVVLLQLPYCCHHHNHG